MNHTRIIKSLLLLAALVVGELSVQAQSLPFSWTQSSPSLTFAVDSNGTLVAAGPYNASATLSGVETGAGMRFMWFPGYGALRAGYGNWTTSNIGKYSMALGYDTTASGFQSAAFGAFTTASGSCSLAANSESTAVGDYSAAFNYWTTAAGTGSVTFGIDTLADNDFACAFGDTTQALGVDSSSFGFESVASADYSFASGAWTTASGTYASALGYGTVAKAFGSVAIGSNNIGAGDSNNWVLTDPLFEIGNGLTTSGVATTPSDAFVVYKNGSAAFQGPVTVGAGGDIPMFGN